VLVACAAVFLVSAAIHVVVWWQYRSDPFSITPVADALSYDRWAARISERGPAAEPVFHQSPLYPLWLSAVYALVPESGRSLWTLGLQALLTSAALASLVPLGRLGFGSSSTGVAAALVALLHGPFVFYSMKLLPVSLALFTQAVGLVILFLARQSGRSLLAGAAGAAWGLACLARSEMLLFVPVAIAALWLRPRSGRSRRPPGTVAAYLAALAVVVAPATVHNARKGDFVVIASSAGENLFIGNHRGAKGGYAALRPGVADIFSQRLEAQRVAEQDRSRPLRPSEVSGYWARRAIAEVTADPSSWLVLEARKLGRILHPGDPTDIYSFALERSTYIPFLHALPVTPWAILLLGCVGGGLLLRGGCHSGWPVLGLVAVHAIVLLAFFVDARLRLPLLFFLCPFAGLAITTATRRWRIGQARLRVAVLGVAVVGSAVAGAFFTRPSPRDVVRLASVLSRQDRLDESLAVLAPSLGPDADATVHDQAGWVRQKKGDYARAGEHYRTALDRGLPPLRARQTRTRLAQVEERLGRIEEAAAQHDAAVASGLANAGTFFERGMFRLRRGNRAAAIGDLRRAVELDPAWPAPRAALARIDHEGP
jgi:hypothetical protein